MSDRVKVIKGWEAVLSRDPLDAPWDLIDDTLTLLKEQEPVAPVLVGRMWECGKCYAPVGIFMDDQRDQFCRTCGRRVKWE